MGKNELKVKYHNDLNAVIMRKWTPQEMNLFFSILAKSKNKGTELLQFDTDELKQLTQFADTHTERWADTMVSAINKIAMMTYVERTEKRARAMTLFSCLDLDIEKRELYVQVSQQFEYIINEISVNFTPFELQEFVQIKSSYAKTAYRLLKQWRTTGKREFSLEELKLVMDTPKGYRPSEIKKRVLEPILKELSPYFKRLKIKTVKANTRGTPVKGYIFTWTPEKTGEWVDDKYDKLSSPTASPYKQFYLELLVKNGVLSLSDSDTIRKFEAEIFPEYDKLVEKTNLEKVEQHIGYVAGKEYDFALGFFKMSILDYLKRF